MTDYKAGTVAAATVRGVPNVRVMWDGEHSWWHPNTRGFVGSGDVEVTDVRPLVVLDLVAADYLPGEFVSDLRRVLRGDQASAIADQIEAQTKPPRIPEPGLWGVVKVDGVHYVRDSLNPADFQWAVIGSPRPANRRQWDDLIDPVLIREGVEG